MASTAGTSLTREAALERLIGDLEVDQAISVGQAVRHYGLGADDLPGKVVPIEAFVAATHGGNRYRQVAFVALSKRLARLSGASLRHLSGVAETRRLLGAPPSSWQRLAARRRPHRPDALWHSPQGTVAVEYDAGSYSSAQVTLKLDRLRRAGYAGQFWGTPSAARRRHLEHLIEARLGQTRPSRWEAPWASVVYAPWE